MRRRAAITFSEWCKISDQLMGEAGVLVFQKFARGEISFDEFQKGMYAAMPIENMLMMKKALELVKGKA